MVLLHTSLTPCDIKRNYSRQDVVLEIRLLKGCYAVTSDVGEGRGGEEKGGGKGRGRVFLQLISTL